MPDYNSYNTRASIFEREPAAIRGVAVTVVAALIAVAVAFGLDLTQAQQESILTLVAVLAPLVTAVLIRFKVFAPATVDKIVTEADEQIGILTHKVQEQEAE